MSGPPIDAWTSDTVRDLIKLTSEVLRSQRAPGIELVELNPSTRLEARVIVSRGAHALAVYFGQEQTEFPKRLTSWLRAMAAAGPLPLDVVEQGGLQ